jgi:hypothetical protein
MSLSLPKPLPTSQPLQEDDDVYLYSSGCVDQPSVSEPGRYTLGPGAPGSSSWAVAWTGQWFANTGRADYTRDALR